MCAAALHRYKLMEDLDRQRLAAANRRALLEESNKGNQKTD